MDAAYPNANSSSRRMGLFKIVCLSLFTSSTGFTTYSSSLSASVRFQSPASITGRNRIPMSLTSSAIKTPQFSDLPRLTLEEEQELLRHAVEMRRITKIEAELAMKSMHTPLLLERAIAAGYGEELDAYENAIADGQRARELLITRNMGLVHFCINQSVGQRKNLNSLSREDLVQEGAIGLARAIDKWNPAIGGKFSTYAVYWIRAAILRCIAERDDILRVPVHVSQAVKSIEKAARRIGVDLASDTWKQASAAKKLAEEAGLTDRNFEEAMKVRSRRVTGGYVEFESWMQKGVDLVSDVSTLHQQTDIGLSSVESEHLRETLSKYLRPKEMEALSWRYGLVKEASQETTQDKAKRYLAEAEAELFGKAEPASGEMVAKGRWGEAMTFTEVGKKMQVSAEYGRKLCHAALEKLQRAAEEGHLEPALLF